MAWQRFALGERHICLPLADSCQQDDIQDLYSILLLTKNLFYSFTSAVKDAAVPPLICAFVPYCMLRKMLPLLPEMSQMLLTLLHHREHLTLTQRSSGQCLICIGALFSFSRQTPHCHTSPSHSLEEMNSNADPHPAACMHSPEVMKWSTDRNVLSCCQLGFKLYKQAHLSRVNCRYGVQTVFSTLFLPGLAQFTS